MAMNNVMSDKYRYEKYHSLLICLQVDSFTNW